ncbi:COMPLEMENT COMPONENT-RELATED SUSHI DOMAIN-CONTAINING [Ceraceosorus bombacis]|uniref:COMPLEMENT COMPONENT-RELATED SUSHI DOMAIN-CONTAINING n=1 Tax=Ceraceosorus bombacis TaxID=401625 RepID=A0A0P1BEP0_9BASI|nr:COMPLEMENT COMPONENT-RELATED SUSHI DOMAIN-CONTAINING [Ceraceosorus bombacis]
MLLLLVVAASGIANATPWCGSERPLAQLHPRVDASEHFTPRHHARARAQGEKTTVVPIAWHVVYNKKAGNVSSATIKKQVRKLNHVYSKTLGIKFEIANITRTRSDWAQTALTLSYLKDSASRQMREALHTGGPGTINVYSLDFPDARGIELKGYSSFPEDIAGSPKLDGISFDYKTMPGQVRNGTTSIGMTLVHEMGHAFGLQHTFVGGCDGEGDGVDDTPAQQFPTGYTSGCPVGQVDSCPNLPGKDDVSNIMNYVPQHCYRPYGFTKGQIARMKTLSSKYRGFTF